jgi:hypothetical protein
MTLRRALWAPLVFFVAVLACPARAQNPAINFTSFSTVNSGPWCLGWEFEVLYPYDVVELGMFSYPGIGLSPSGNAVGLFNPSGSLLAWTVVYPSDPQVGYFQFRALTTPVTLTPGAGYRIAGVTGSAYYAYDYSGPFGGWSVDPRLRFMGDWYIAGNTLQWPTEEDPGITYAWFGPNMMIRDSSAVPEPALLQLPALLLLGGFAWRIRRRP